MDDIHHVSSSDHIIANLERKLSFFIKQLNKLVTSVDFKTFKNDTTGIEYAKFCSTLSFILCSISHAQAHGPECVDTPCFNLPGIFKEQFIAVQNRIKSYMKQINTLQTKEPERRPRIDKEAAKRLIKFST